MFLDEESWEDIQEKCSKFSGSRNNIPKNNIKQAMFPLEADIIPNPNGTAPGAIFKDKSGKKDLMRMWYLNQNILGSLELASLH